MALPRRLSFLRLVLPLQQVFWEHRCYIRGGMPVRRTCAPCPTGVSAEVNA